MPGAAVVCWMAAAAAGLTLYPCSRWAAATLAGEGEDEVPVITAFFGGRFALQQRHGVAEVPEPVVPELFGRVISRVAHLGFRRHDFVKQLAFAVLGACFGVGLCTCRVPAVYLRR